MKNIKLELDNHNVINITLNVDRDCDNLDIQVMGPGECSGEITSTLHVSPKNHTMSRWTRMKYNSMIDSLESMILAHACAGVDVESIEYMTGIETTLEAIDNNLF